MSQEAIQFNVVFWIFLIGMAFYFFQRNKGQKLVALKFSNEYKHLILDLSRKGEKLVEENIYEDTIIAKLKGNFGQGLIITDKRLYVLKWGWMAGHSYGGGCTGFEYKNITGFEISRTSLMGTFQVLTPSNQERPRTANAIQSDNMVTFSARYLKLFQEAIKIGREHLQNPNLHSIQDGASNYIELEKLAELKDKGIVTKEEFESKKKQLLGLG